MAYVASPDTEAGRIVPLAGINADPLSWDRLPLAKQRRPLS